jgi:hypothetical protein
MCDTIYSLKILRNPHRLTAIINHHTPITRELSSWFVVVQICDLLFWARSVHNKSSKAVRFEDRLLLLPACPAAYTVTLFKFFGIDYCNLHHWINFLWLLVWKRVWHSKYRDIRIEHAHECSSDIHASWPLQTYTWYFVWAVVAMLLSITPVCF